LHKKRGHKKGSVYLECLNPKAKNKHIRTEQTVRITLGEHRATPGNTRFFNITALKQKHFGIESAHKYRDIILYKTYAVRLVRLCSFLASSFSAARDRTLNPIFLK
jgi:hypothetical protein